VTTPSVGIANHRFAYGYYRQTFWNWLIGTAFFLGGLGAGLFVLALLTDHTAGMLAGYLIVVVGKNTAHMLFLGRPERVWRAAMRPDRSWIARGIWAMGFFAVSGLILLLPRVLGPAWRLSDWLNGAAAAVAILSAIIIMFYDGLVMNSSPGVAFWRTRLLPLLLLMYATLGGSTLSLTIRELRGEVTPSFLPNLEHGLLVVNFVLLAAYLAHEPLVTRRARDAAPVVERAVYARVLWTGSAGRTVGHSAALGGSESRARERAGVTYCRL
jgi:formate-dependent nitrite reductase membrane component NrfD